jgi:hypothetical protein
MNASIRVGLACGCLTLLLSASARATPPNPDDLPPGSGILIPPGSGGPTFHLKIPPTFPGQLPPTVPGWMLKKHGEPYPKPLPRPQLRPVPGPRPHLPGPATIIPYRPKPFSPVIPLPPPRGPQVRPRVPGPQMGQFGRQPAYPPIRLPVHRFFGLR